MRFTLLFLLFTITTFSQNVTPDNLFTYFETVKEKSITDRRFKHSDIQVLLEQFSKNDLFKIKKIGESVEGRDINLVSIGKGKINVLLWSQMHGNEPTATMALMDIFNFFNTKNEFGEFKKILQEELTLHVIPMLNPDGAERYRRRNARDVDLNRDALRLQNPESRILKHIRDSLQADWGFNLHDQNPYYGAGQTKYTASVSFLAPAYNYEKEVNEVRGNAMKLIVKMNDVLQAYIPHKIGRYSDDFEPRAFGDNIQKWGTSTILIESGGLKGDPEKQHLRKLHFVLLLSSFQSIANGDFRKEKLEDYEKIPFNESNQFHDLILRKVHFVKKRKPFTMDIAFRYWERNFNGNRSFYIRSSIRDLGDLHTVYGYEEWDASEYQAEVGKVYPKKFRKIKQLKKLNLRLLLKQGYTRFYVKKMPPKQDLDNLPISLFSSKDKPRDKIALGRNPSLVFKQKEAVKVVLINGHLFDLDKDKKNIEEALQYF